MAEAAHGLYAGAEGRVPSTVVAGQRVAEVEDHDVVVFVVGMRVNRWRRVQTWVPIFVAMPRMLRELTGDPSSGLLAARTCWSGRVFMVLQHWRSLEDLGRYSRDSRGEHAPAWARWNKSRGPASGDVGLFHETYLVPAGGVESRYSNMAPLGLAAAYGTLPRAGRRRRSRAEDRVEGIGPPPAA